MDAEPPRCPCCGLALPAGVEICPHHVMDLGDDLAMAETNRVMCAFFHRGEPPSRVAEVDCVQGEQSGGLPEEVRRCR